MPWQLPPELAERVQRARRLLEEPEAHGSAQDLQASQAASVHVLEMKDATHAWLHNCGAFPSLQTVPTQHFLESASLNEQLHQPWLNEDGSERLDLSDREKQQVCGDGLDGEGPAQLRQQGSQV